MSAPITGDFCCTCGAGIWRLMVLQAFTSNTLTVLNCLQADPSGASCGFPPGGGLFSEPRSAADAVADALHAEIMSYDMDNPPVAYGANFAGWNPSVATFCTMPNFRQVVKYPAVNPVSGLWEYAWHSSTPGDGTLPGGMPFPFPDSGAPQAGAYYLGGNLAGFSNASGTYFYYYWIVSVLRFKIFNYPQICESVTLFNGFSRSVISCGLVAIPGGIKDYTYFAHPTGPATSSSSPGSCYRVQQPWLVDNSFGDPGNPCAPHPCQDCTCTA